MFNPTCEIKSIRGNPVEEVSNKISNDETYYEYI